MALRFWDMNSRVELWSIYELRHLPSNDEIDLPALDIVYHAVHGFVSLIDLFAILEF